MGLNVSVRKYGEEGYMSEEMGSYKGYNEWRRQIAFSAGFEGYNGHDHWNGKEFELILNHSNCDGEYSVDQLPALLDEILAIKKLNIDYLDQCDKYIRLIEHAMKLNEPLMFM